MQLEMILLDDFSHPWDQQMIGAFIPESLHSYSYLYLPDLISLPLLLLV